jgi:transcription antitermination factor NusG
MEASVSRALKSLDFQHIVFKIRRQIAARGRLLEQVRPVFPGYVFVVARDAWIVLRNIVGVLGFVHFGDRLENVPDDVVEGLRAQADADGVLNWSLPDGGAEPRLRQGDAVQVTLSGATYRGAFFAYLAFDRAIIHLDWMGRMVPVSVNLCDLGLEVRRSSGSRRRPRRRRR